MPSAAAEFVHESPWTASATRALATTLDDLSGISYKIIDRMYKAWTWYVYQGFSFGVSKVTQDFKSGLGQIVWIKTGRDDRSQMYGYMHRLTWAQHGVAIVSGRGSVLLLNILDHSSLSRDVWISCTCLWSRISASGPMPCLSAVSTVLNGSEGVNVMYQPLRMSRCLRLVKGRAPHLRRASRGTMSGMCQDFRWECRNNTTSGRSS